MQQVERHDLIEGGNIGEPVFGEVGDTAFYFAISELGNFQTCCKILLGVAMIGSQLAEIVGEEFGEVLFHGESVPLGG